MLEGVIIWIGLTLIKRMVYTFQLSHKIRISELET